MKYQMILPQTLKARFVLLILLFMCLSNSFTLSSASLEKVYFSRPSGFYPESFDLQMWHNQQDVTIRYTIDGSIPSSHSEIFTDNILIYNRCSDPLTISRIPTSRSWQMPGELQKQAMVINAVAFKEGYEPSPVNSAVFFINDDDSFTHEMAVLSIITDPDNLFNQQTGIYVIGDGAKPNYDQTGDEWERPAHLDFFELDRSLVYSDGIGIRIHGGTSRQFPQKSLRLYFRNEYGDNWLNHEVFPGHEITKFKRLILRATGHDDSKALIRDGFMQALLDDLNIDKQAYRPCVLYINGEFWGIHKIRERIDKYYLNTHHGVDVENIDLLSGRHYAPSEGDALHYESMIAFIENNNLSDNENYAHLQTLMHTDSYIDYIISEIFFYRWDTGNIKYWREKTPESKWRWIMFDLDTGYGGFWSINNAWEFNMLEYNSEANGAWTGYLGHNHNSAKATFLFRNLLKNQIFKDQFIIRFADLLNTNFKTDFSHYLIDSFANAISDEMALHISRWKRIESVDKWNEEVDRLRIFASLRPDIQRNQLIDFFNLDGTIDVSIDVNQLNAGHVKINTSHIRASTPGVNSMAYPWAGKYFKGQEINLEAMASHGYKFSHWEGDINSTSQTLVLDSSEDINLKACFSKTDEAVLIHYWLFNNDLLNDTPLTEIDPWFSTVSGASITFTSCYDGYPFHKNHLLWRKASMERRNNPTSFNYREEGNNNIPFEEASMRGLQIKQPFAFEDLENSIMLNVPTTGYDDIVFKFSAQDEMAADNLLVEYSLNAGQTWTNEELMDASPLLNQNNFVLYAYDFKNIESSNNNPDFKIRIRFAASNRFVDNGSRVTFNNFSVDGTPRHLFFTFAENNINGTITPSGTNGFEPGSDIELSIKANEGYEITDVLLDNSSIKDELSFDDNGAATYILYDISANHTIKAVITSTLSIGSTQKTFHVFPNPASDKLFVSSDYPINRIDIANMQGQIILSDIYHGEGKVTINTGHLNKGIYLVLISTSSSIVTEKLLIINGH